MSIWEEALNTEPLMKAAYEAALSFQQTRIENEGQFGSFVKNTNVSRDVFVLNFQKKSLSLNIQIKSNTETISTHNTDKSQLQVILKEY